MRISKKLWILSILCIGIIVSCSHKSKPDNNLAINIEMLGSWHNDSGCVAVFAKTRNQLILTKFTDGKNHTLNNVLLISRKESIMNTFKSQNSTIDFSGNFVEGMIIINTYCIDPLHKTDK